MNRYFIFLIAIFTFGTAIASEELAEQCARCHYTEEGEMAELGATFESIKGIVDGTVEHKRKLKLTDEEIQSLVDYFSTIEPSEGEE